VFVFHVILQKKIMSSDKFRNKYRTDSARAQWYNYGGNGAYFVTICTKNREHYFGKIVNGTMRLSEIGEIAQSEWQKTKELRSDMNLLLGEFIVMPNHFHCVVCIGDNPYNDCRRDAMHCVSTITTHNNKFGVQSKNLSSIIRGFKIAVTMYAKKHNMDFAWQPRFHDRIIRNKNEYKRIANYIINNPETWDMDRLNSVVETQCIASLP